MTLVLKNSGKPEILATNKLEEGFDASPAIAGKEVFLRGHKLSLLHRKEKIKAMATDF